MRRELIDQIIDIEPEFFQTVIERDGKRYVGVRTIECGDGWFPLIKALVEVAKHRRDHPSWRPGPERYVPPAECPEGSDFYDGHDCQRPYNHFRVEQVKEKFGGLRFYTNFEDPSYGGMIWLAESLSYQICEECGSWGGEPWNAKGWRLTLCEKHGTEFDAVRVREEAG